MAELIPLTHDELVAKAAKFLETPHRGKDYSQRLPAHCVITTGIGCGEIPDVLGFYGAGWTTLIEVKVSRADFLSDAKKPFRSYPSHGMGDYRYYLTPEGMLDVDELPSGWGLMEWRGKKLKVVKWGCKMEARKAHEMSVLLSLIRRIGQNAPQGVSIKFYSYETKNSCTAGACVDSECDIPTEEVTK